MKCQVNGVLVYHPYEHVNPDAKLQETVGETTFVNTDVLIEDSWKDGDIDFIVAGDLYVCPSCGRRVITGFGEKMVDHKTPQKHLQEMVQNAKQRGYAVKILRK